MSGFFGGGSRINSGAPAATGLRISGSIAGKPRPIVWGQVRLAYTLLWAANFTYHNQSGGGGKGGSSGKGGGSSYYSVDAIQGICEGPVAAVPTVFDQNGDKGPPSGTSLIPARTVYLGTYTQNPDSLTESDLGGTQALGYRGTCYTIGVAMNIGDSPNVPNETFEVVAAINTTVSGFPDACPSLIVKDFLTNPYYGLGFPPALLDPANIDPTNVTSMASYCRANGLLMSPALSDARAASDFVNAILKACNCSARWSGGLLTFVPWGDAAITANGCTYTPVTAPLYSFGDDDFIAKSGDAPVIVTVKDQSQTNNDIKVQYLDRGNNYNPEIAEAWDDALIQTYGKRSADANQDNLFCLATAAQMSAQLQLGREQIVNTYQVTVAGRYILLDVEDIVALTDAALGLDDTTVRIIEIQEQGDGTLKITAEDYLIGSGNAPVYGKTPKQGLLPDLNAAADSVNPPIIIEPPGAATGGIAQVWIGASGGASGTADPNWGGCYVWASTDGSTYQNIGQITAPCRQGFLTATLAAYGGASPDNTDTLSIDLTESAGQTLQANDTAAALAQTLCYVDGELLAYANSTLTSAYHYNLSYLYRGLYGTTAGSHAATSVFLRCDAAIFKYDMPADYVGQALHFKLQSYNIYGGGLEELSACTAYTLTPTGVGYYVAPPSSVVVTSAATVQADGSHLITVVVSWTASPDLLLDHYEVQTSVDGGTTWSASAVVGSNANSWRLPAASALTNYTARVRAISKPGNQSAWVTSATTETVALTTTVPSTPTGFSATGGATVVVLNWAANPEPDVQGYVVWSTEGHDSSFGDASIVAIVSALTWTHTNLGYGETRTYWLEAYNVAGRSTQAGPAYATTSYTIPVVAIGEAAISTDKLIPILQVQIASLDALSQQAITSAAQSGLASSFIGQEQITRASADQALANLITQVSSSFGSSIATFESNVTTLTSAVAANASAVTTLTTSLAGNTAAVSAAQTSVNGLEARYTVQVEIDSGGAQYIGGFGLAGGPDGSGGIAFNATFLVNTFTIAQLIGGTLSTISPFFVSGGNVYIQNALINQVAANKITSGTITTALLTVQPTTSAQGLKVYDYLGNLVLDPTHGVYPGQATLQPSVSGSSVTMPYGSFGTLVDLGSLTYYGRFAIASVAISVASSIYAGSQQSFQLELVLDGTVIQTWQGNAYLAGASYLLDVTIPASIMGAGSHDILLKGASGNGGGSSMTATTVSLTVCDFKA